MTGFLDQFLAFLLGFGVVGMGILALLDSTFFFYLPFALDAIFIILTSKHRDMMPIYALIIIAGSIIGCALTYLVMREASKETIEKTIPKRKFNRVKKKVEHGGFFGLVIASLLPPPFPFTPFVIAAAVSDLPVKRTFAAILVGRSIRYFGEGVLALLLGSQILQLLEAPAFKFFMLALFTVAIIGTGISIYKWLKN
jgi:membrane protein YqaA with SNARE-associated domain